MGLICSTINFILAYLGYLWFGSKKFYSPLFLFAFFWGVLCFLAELHLYGLYETSDFAYFCVLIGMVGFTIGCVLVKQNTRTFCSRSQSINPTMFNFLLLLCIVGLYINFKLILSFVFQGFDFSYIYYIMASDPSGEGAELSGLFSENLLRLQQFVGYPLLYTIVPIAIVEYIETRKKYYLYIAIFLSLLRFMVDIRRAYIVIIVAFVFVFLIIRRANHKRLGLKIKKLTLKKKITLVASIFAITLSFSILSQVRLTENDENSQYSVFANFNSYYVGSLPYFSQRLQQMKTQDYTYGFTSFRGLASPFVAVLKLLGVEKNSLMQKANDNVTSLHAVTLPISPTTHTNSYATLFFEFFLDGGLFGVFIFSLLFGYYSQNLFYKAEIYKTKRYMCKYAYFVSMFLLLSVLHFNGVVVCYIWPFILERFFYKKSSVRSLPFK